MYTFRLTQLLRYRTRKNKNSFSLKKGILPGHTSMHDSKSLMHILKYEQWEEIDENFIFKVGLGATKVLKILLDIFIMILRSDRVAFIIQYPVDDQNTQLSTGTQKTLFCLQFLLLSIRMIVLLKISKLSIWWWLLETLPPHLPLGWYAATLNFHFLPDGYWSSYKSC